MSVLQLLQNKTDRQQPGLTVVLLTHASFSEVKCHFVGLKLSDVHRKATRRPEICKSRRVCDRTTECDLQEVAITHLSCLKWLNASCRRVVFTPFFSPLDLVSAASLRLQRNIKLYMLDVLTLCYLQ